ncbi:hypothetical protein ACFWDI_39480 [Streptomyces sp. NPDC060064]|uniref:hypothetical protein n=1 Tax=Streptomyces sp. NPDC060064 TaxID=3347049 RepID=UPI00368FED77
MSSTGPAGISKTCLLRAAGRAAQQEIEAGTGGRRQNTIPVVHITTPAGPERKVNWVWEITSCLGLQPEPKSLAEVLEMRRHQDLTLPVNYVLETAQTRLLLIDDINRATAHQLANVLSRRSGVQNRLGCCSGPAARDGDPGLRQDDAGRRDAVHGNVQAPVGVTGHEPASGPRGVGGREYATGERATQESDDHSGTSIRRDSHATNRVRRGQAAKRLKVPAATFRWARHTGLIPDPDASSCQ